MTPPRALFARALACAFLAACGADVDSYTPSLGGLHGEGYDPSQPHDVSFADGMFIVQVGENDCGDTPQVFDVVPIIVDNELRKTTVQLRVFDDGCKEVKITPSQVAPSTSANTAVNRGNVVRVYDATTSAFLSAWKVTSVNSLGTDRIVLRNTSPDI